MLTAATIYRQHATFFVHEKNIASIALAITACFAAATSNAAVIDFNGLAGTSMPGDNWAFPNLYTAFSGPMQLNGYSFSSSAQAMWIAGDTNAMIFCGGSNVDCAAVGSDYLLADPALTVQRVDAGAFTLKSFDLGNYYDSEGDNSSPAQSSYLLTATLNGGGTVEHILTLDDIPNFVSYGTADLNHFTFGDLDGITSFTISGVTPRQWQGMALDNLEVDATTAGTVPEPGSLALLGLGMAGLAWQRKRRAA
jgi:hypothetical protein